MASQGIQQVGKAEPLEINGHKVKWCRGETSGTVRTPGVFQCQKCGE